MSSETPHPSGLSRSEIPCKFLGRGRCYIPNCPYSHDPTVETPKLDRPCLEWQAKGKCKLGKSFLYRHDESQASTMMENLEDGVLQAFEVGQIMPVEDSVEVLEHRTLGSYNWTSSVKPTILIPGFAPRFILPKESIHLEPDDLKFGGETRDAAIPYEPRSEPLLRSVKAQQRDFKFEEVDLVTGLNNIRQLFSLCGGKDEYAKDSFRIDVEVAGRAVYMSRWDDNANLALGSPCRGYGRGFEERCTIKPEFEHFCITSYHRIVEYRLGATKLIVQYECDASTEEREDCLQPLDQSQMSPVSVDSLLLVYEVGMPVSCDSLVEIKSQELNNKSSLDRTLVQLYFSGTKQLLLGRHSKGNFKPDSIRVQDMRADIQDWANRSQSQLRIFCKLLENIQTAVLEQHNKMGCKSFALLVAKKSISLHRRVGGMKIVPDNLEAVAFAQEQIEVHFR